jgi:hypothetical protein
MSFDGIIITDHTTIRLGEDEKRLPELVPYEEGVGYKVFAIGRLFSGLDDRLAYLVGWTKNEYFFAAEGVDPIITSVCACIPEGVLNIEKFPKVFCTFDGYSSLLDRM